MTFRRRPATLLLDTTLRSTGYAVSEVSREFPTEFVHFAGQRVFVLNDGQCDYAMKYYTSIFDPELVNEDAVATLGERFTPPSGGLLVFGPDVRRGPRHHRRSRNPVCDGR